MDSQLKQEIIDLFATLIKPHNCLLYTSDAADER